MMLLGRLIQVLWWWRSWRWERWEYPPPGAISRQRYGVLFVAYRLGPLEVRVWRKGHGRGH